jgi:hypothetical protein
MAGDKKRKLKVLRCVVSLGSGQEMRTSQKKSH